MTTTLKRLLAASLGFLFVCSVAGQSPVKNGQEPKKQAARESPAETLVVCRGLLQPQSSTPLGFAKATLVSLWYARNASERGNEMKQGGYDADYMFSHQTALLSLSKTSINDFVCAKRAVKTFTSTQSDEAGNNRTAAHLLMVVYDSHISINQRLIDIIKKPGNTNKTELSDQILILQVEREQRWADLIRPTILGLVSMVDKKRTDENGHLNHLIITKDERKNLLDWANANFPEFTNGVPEEKWPAPSKTAQMYFSFLNARKCSDE
jgi:hypothetical protein